MSYSPRPGSQADKAIRHICDSGRALRTNEIAIDDDGALRVRIDDDTLDFTPAHTTALGDFLTLTEGLWRP